MVSIEYQVEWGPRTKVNALEKKIICPCWEPNHSSSSIHFKCIVKSTSHENQQNTAAAEGADISVVHRTLNNSPKLGYIPEQGTSTCK
jgi:hypothetical protein